MTDEKITVIKTGELTGWIIALLLVIIIGIAAGYLYSTGAFDQSNDLNIKIELPKVD